MKNTSTALLLALPVAALAQWQNQGAYVTVYPNTYLACESNVLVESGTLRNQGTVASHDLKSATAGTLRGGGLWEVHGDIHAEGTLLDDSEFQLLGDGDTVRLATFGNTLYSLVLDKDGPLVAVLQDPLTVGKSLKFLTNQNRIFLGSHDLLLKSGGGVTNATSTKFVVTNGTGRFRRENSGSASFTFPVGFSADTYNPIAVANTGVADEIGVRVLSTALSGGGSGTPVTADGVAAMWELTEAVPGGSTLNLTAQWRTADELPGFLRTACSVRRWNGAAWDSSPLGAATGAGTGANPWKRTRTGVAGVGYFAVLDGGFPLAPPAGAELRNEAGEMVDGGERLECQAMPNPFDNQLFIAARGARGTQKLSTRAFDLTGRVIAQQTFPEGSERLKLDTRNWLPGVYQIQILNAEGRVLQVLQAVKIGD